jgi:hypothetical protein
MKVIISHDLDHVSAWEHRKDLIIPKYLVRNVIEFLLGYISTAELTGRFGSLAGNRLHNMRELMEFDRERKVPSTFFIAVSNGRNLSYNLADAKRWVGEAGRRGFDIGVHGIDFADAGGVAGEHELFREMSGTDGFGVRIHDIGTGERDVIMTNENLRLLSEAGYRFSSSTFEWKDPFKVGEIWEFPVNLMDTHLFCRHARWQNQSLEQARKETGRLLDDACSRGLRFFSILFHDMYFSKNFKAWRAWYCWLIDYCTGNGLPLVNYREAVRELEGADLRTTGAVL